MPIRLTRMRIEMINSVRLLFSQLVGSFVDRFTIAILLSFLFFVPSLEGAEKASGLEGEVSDLSTIPTQLIRGRIVCLAEEMHAVYDTHLPTNHEHIYGFKAKEGQIFTVLRTKLSEAIFVDERVRDRELILSVRVLPLSRVIDVVTIKSVKDEVVHDLYYYCFICSIRTVDPAICLCCQEPVEFMEVPLE
jgi:hypothetical protein